MCQNESIISKARTHRSNWVIDTEVDEPKFNNVIRDRNCLKQGNRQARFQRGK